MLFQFKSSIFQIKKNLLDNSFSKFKKETLLKFLISNKIFFIYYIFKLNFKINKIVLKKRNINFLKLSNFILKRLIFSNDL